MDDGIEQNPAYGTARILDLQDKYGFLLPAIGSLTPRFTPTGLSKPSKIEPSTRRPKNLRDLLYMPRTRLGYNDLGA
jgi:hypothetical protein